jgi:hypothetical protein
MIVHGNWSKRIIHGTRCHSLLLLPADDYNLAYYMSHGWYIEPGVGHKHRWLCIIFGSLAPSMWILCGIPYIWGRIMFAIYLNRPMIKLWHHLKGKGVYKNFWYVHALCMHIWFCLVSTSFYSVCLCMRLYLFLLLLIAFFFLVLQDDHRCTDARPERGILQGWWRR